MVIYETSERGGGEIEGEASSDERVGRKWADLIESVMAKKVESFVCGIENSLANRRMSGTPSSW